VDFDFLPKQEELRTEVREFARKELAPHSAEWDKNETFPWEAVKLMGKRGYRDKKDTVESHLVYLACQNTATLYELSSSTEVVN